MSTNTQKELVNNLHTICSNFFPKSLIIYARKKVSSIIPKSAVVVIEFNWAIIISRAIPFTNPDITKLGTYLTNLWTFINTRNKRNRPERIRVKFTKIDKSKLELLVSQTLSVSNITAIAAVIGPVGVLTPYLEPPINEVIKVIKEVEIIPINAPLPDKTPNAAPSVITTILTLSGAIKLIFLKFFLTNLLTK